MSASNWLVIGVVFAFVFVMVIASPAGGMLYARTLFWIWDTSLLRRARYDKRANDIAEFKWTLAGRALHYLEQMPVRETSVLAPVFIRHIREDIILSSMNYERLTDRIHQISYRIDEELGVPVVYASVVGGLTYRLFHCDAVRIHRALLDLNWRNDVAIRRAASAKASANYDRDYSDRNAIGMLVR
jgi:hypothetical protein